MKKSLSWIALILLVTLSILWPSAEAAKLVRANQINLGDVFAFTGANTHGGTETFNAQIVTQSIVPNAAGTFAIGTTAAPYSGIVIGSASGLASNFSSAATAVRNVVWPDAGGTASLAVVQYCGLTSGASQTCANTVEKLPIIIYGEVTLNSAATQSITSLPFTAAADYSCWGSDLTTAAGIVSFNTYAASSVTIQESGGVNTDHLRWGCAGF